MGRPHKLKPDYTYRDSFPPLDEMANPGYIIAFSGGRDSSTCMEMALELTGDSRYVRPFLMSLLPGKLDYYQFWREFAKKRWGTTVYEYEHWALSWYLRRGIFQYQADPDYPRVTLAHVEHRVRSDYQLDWICYGYKAIDSLQRRGMLNKWQYGICPNRMIFCPLKDWAGHHVDAFLTRRRLSQSLNPAYQSHGIDMSPQCMWWLRKYWPADYRRMLGLFPLAVAQADRWDRYLSEKMAAGMVGGGRVPIDPSSRPMDLDEFSP